MLRVQGASTFYGRIQALRDVTLSVEQGEIVALIGANGAGKTTLLNTVCGLVPPQAGTVEFCGQRITGLPPEKTVRLGISHVPERRQVFASMPVVDNLLLGAYHRHGRRQAGEIDADLKAVHGLFPVLARRARQLAGTLSGGEQQMIAIGRGLMARPRLLLLDEPSLGLAPLVVKEVFAVIERLRERGTTVLLVEQNARAALRIADRGYVLEGGRVVLEGRSSDLMEDASVRAAYLGRVNGHQSQVQPAAGVAQ